MLNLPILLAYLTWRVRCTICCLNHDRIESAWAEFVKDGEQGVSGFGGGGEIVVVGGTKHRMDLCRWVWWAVGVSIEVGGVALGRQS